MKDSEIFTIALMVKYIVGVVVMVGCFGALKFGYEIFSTSPSYIKERNLRRVYYIKKLGMFFCAAGGFATMVLGTRPHGATLHETLGYATLATLLVYLLTRPRR